MRKLARRAFPANDDYHSPASAGGVVCYKGMSGERVVRPRGIFLVHLSPQNSLTPS
jgi:hypothetical protein